MSILGLTTAAAGVELVELPPINMPENKSAPSDGVVVSERNENELASDTTGEGVAAPADNDGDVDDVEDMANPVRGQTPTKRPHVHILLRESSQVRMHTLKRFRFRHFTYRERHLNPREWTWMLLVHLPAV